ncbi:SCAR5-like protein [Mya arenaria]|uniref:SCAR5-like protein n=1 Tax=Mya arenaria TaxID=6604 RepID=A0ABY7G4N1_MYAAR|nr:SCAR5-like protein [Mya arenaria]
MRLVQLFLIVFLAALMPIQGSRLRRLEEDVNALKSFMFRELGSIRDQVNEISIRVETLENSTATSDPGSPNRDMDIFSYNLGDKTGESGKKLKRAGNNDANLQTVSLNIQHVEEKQNHLFVLTCNEDFSVNNGTIQDGYYYPCARDIRLANASTYRFIGVQGRLEVRYDNSWGTVCDDTFEKGIRNTNVKVVCRMFGFRECDCVREAGLGEGSGVIWMDDVECGGGESSILNCHHRGWGSNNCGHSEDVGIQLWN